MSLHLKMRLWSKQRALERITTLIEKGEPHGTKGPPTRKQIEWWQKLKRGIEDDIHNLENGIDVEI